VLDEVVEDRLLQLWWNIEGLQEHEKKEVISHLPLPQNEKKRRWRRGNGKRSSSTKITEEGEGKRTVRRRKETLQDIIFFKETSRKRSEEVEVRGT